MKLPEGEPIIGKTYIADGWQYRDIPNLSPKMWDYLFSMIGNENEHYVFLSTSSIERNGELWAKRGQILISPIGMENLASSVAVKH